MTFASNIEFDLANVLFDVDGGGPAVEATTSTAAKVPGILFNEPILAQPGLASVGVGSSEPVFRMLSTTATGLGRGKALTIGGVAYEVVEPRDSGRGWTDLRLHLT